MLGDASGGPLYFVPFDPLLTVHDFDLFRHGDFLPDRRSQGRLQRCSKAAHSAWIVLKHSGACVR